MLWEIRGSILVQIELNILIYANPNEVPTSYEFSINLFDYPRFETKQVTWSIIVKSIDGRVVNTKFLVYGPPKITIGVLPNISVFTLFEILILVFF